MVPPIDALLIDTCTSGLKAPLPGPVGVEERAEGRGGPPGGGIGEGRTTAGPPSVGGSGCPGGRYGEGELATGVAVARAGLAARATPDPIPSPASSASAPPARLQRFSKCHRRIGPLLGRPARQVTVDASRDTIMEPPLPAWEPLVTGPAVLGLVVVERVDGLVGRITVNRPKTPDGITQALPPMTCSIRPASVADHHACRVPIASGEHVGSSAVPTAAIWVWTS